ncbi:MAG: 4-hydroxy-3-methylbut-2-enyl diphosphate reductase [Gammaproteobacteria bacterium]|jgi:4-hydroxy-3-methylbut-2-enyl diphosphate reductase|nr:4-hydroxy-3-methylbut-2-enyl diphosphate reductase [Gammaproteobacteria bacterium]MBT3488686.1 4-hydroxy-3-methylbut-2-enyl diphosphate reductase [Gammaproteobacteria bacterium]MBT3717432.1 4-hydroxy-3-methylbut-2-enyl diphosphate reductase [Gammaproteobacteria bacterium]MBT3844211.1 4-hydroxy-3-methylbut-2-enyl diphosphate reductase [Gammaproteobacteria bacterium]MBT3892088.1 4-hydroxy-3-methylbut-2-enyl diphosphate reductase [Gammaproteobacteria bacterium]
MKIQLANPRGFCAGVERAITIVEQALKRFGAPIYVRHEVVHNRYVVEQLRASGAVFVQELSEVPEGERVIFSAHGVAAAVEDEAKARGLIVYDATCPLVTKVHLHVARLAKAGQDVVLIGHAGHPEVEGTLGRYPNNQQGKIHLVESAEQVGQLQVSQPEQLSYATQTTLSMDDATVVIDTLKQRFPSLQGPKRDDICYATQNRQNAIKQLASQCEVVLVVGSANSSNSNRLREIAKMTGATAYLIDTAEEIEPSWFDEVEQVGISAGASAPEILVEGVVERLQQLGAMWNRQESGDPEDVFFPLPVELR